MSHDAQKRSLKIHVTTWGPTGVGVSFGELDLAEVFGFDPNQVAIVGVTVKDGDREITYDTESYDVALSVDGRQVKDFADELIPTEV